jgi:hypothetical protein
VTEIVPKTITAGVTFSAAAEFPSHSDGWDIVLHMRGPSAIDLLAAQWGDVFTFASTANDTGGWSPGEYAWVIRATRDDEVAELAKGQTKILPNLLASGPGYDARSDWRKGLDAIDAVLAKRATLDQQSYKINDRELSRTPIADLLRLRNFYQQKVNEEKGKGKSWFRDVKVVMRPIGK